MNREDIATTRRRQEALDSLEFEREREEALTSQLEPVIRDAEAWRADVHAFRHMSAEDVETLRRIGFALEAPQEDARARLETKIAELQGMIEDSRSRQRAFERYADALEQARE
jgi:hypothetical protein